MVGAGTRLGVYEVVAPLGAGGMGEVYRARDTRLDRTVAIKVLPSHVSNDPALRERFEREARTIAALNHPHICTLHDVGQQDGTEFLVMEYLDGETLAQRLSKGALPLEQALTIAIQIAAALAVAHRAGIIHRDLKPGNIMLTKSGAKLLDFGLAKVTRAAIAASGLSVAPTGVSPVTVQGMILGTLQYMAPEQVEGKEADVRSDLWSFGTVMYEMATGVRAFFGDTPASVIGSILRDTVPPASRRQPLSPASLDHLIARCLEKDPDERWQNAGDVQRELQWIAGTPAAAAPVAPLRTNRGVGRWLIVGGALAVALIVAAGWWRGGAAPSPAERMIFTIAPPDPIRITGATALSPDGHSIVFVGQGADGPPTLWVRSIDNGAVRQLADTDDAEYPFWAPRADAIAFFAGGKLKTITLAGGPPRVLAPAPSGRGGSWGPDGTILFVPDTTTPIFRVSERGGEAVAVTKLDTTDGQIGHRWPKHVDAQHFLYTVQGAQTDATGIYLATVGSTAAARLVPEYSNSVYYNGHVLYVAESAIVARPLDPMRGTVGDPVEVAGPVAYTKGLGFSAFSVAPNLLSYAAGTGATPTSLTQWFDRLGKPLGRLGAGSELSNYNAYYQQISPDGRKVAISAFQSTTADLWLVDMERDVSSRITFNDATELSPVWSPDSTELMYVSNRDGFYNIYRQSLSKPGEEHRVTEATSHKYTTDWSADGRTIVFTNMDPRTQADIWTMPATGGKPMPFLATTFNEYAGRLSPDGQWLAYTSDESGRPEVYVQRFPSGRDKSRLSTQGGSHPQWRADGRELFYLAANRTLSALSMTLAPSLIAGRPGKIFDVPVDTSIGSMHAVHFVVSADGQRFLLGVSVINQKSTTVVLNWTSALK